MSLVEPDGRDTRGVFEKIDDSIAKCMWSISDFFDPNFWTFSGRGCFVVVLIVIFIIVVKILGINII